MVKSFCDVDGYWFVFVVYGGLVVVEVGDGVGVEGVDVLGILYVWEVWVYLE